MAKDRCYKIISSTTESNKRLSVTLASFMYCLGRYTRVPYSSLFICNAWKIDLDMVRDRNLSINNIFLWFFLNNLIRIMYGKLSIILRAPIIIVLRRSVKGWLLQTITFGLISDLYLRGRFVVFNRCCIPDDVTSLKGEVIWSSITLSLGI